MSKSLLRRGAVLAGAIALMGTMTAAPATAAQSPSLCSFGDLCLERSPLGPIVRVPEGESRTFPTGLSVTSVTNLTSLNYCVRSNPNYAIGPRQTIRRPHTVFAVGPADFCVS